MRFVARIHRGLLISVLALCGLTGAFAQAATTTKVSVEVTNVVDVIGDGKIDWSKEEIRARGIGFAPKFAKTPGQMTVLAREAALVAAERNLLKVINGVHVTSETTVENLEVTQDIIKTSVKGLLKGAVIVSEKPFGENGYEVVLAVNLYDEKNALSQSIDLPVQFKAANPGVTIVPTTPKEDPKSDITPVITPPVTPSVTPSAPEQQPERYTGLVIDCRGLGLARSMCPRILDQTGGNLWSTSMVSVELVNERGIAGYFTTLDDPALLDRVGKHPLVVTALRLGGGKQFKTDAIVSPADAELIRTENQQALFLDKLNVAFLTEN